MAEFKFTKEAVLPATDRASPFYINLPGHDAKPIDNLINFFKYWKYFIKSLIFYFKEIAMVKEFEANLNYQLLIAIQFPGFKDLPRKVILEITEYQKDVAAQNENLELTTSAPNTSSNTTEPKRPGLLKTKSNNSTFLKSNTHKRTASANAGGTYTPPVTSQSTNDVKVPTNFFPDDSLFNNFPPLLLNHHQLQYQTNLKLHKDLTSKLVPRLEVLLKNLSHKIKEIKSSLKNESFSNFQLAKEISDTGRVLSEYTESVGRYSSKVPCLKRKLLSEEDREDEEDEDEGVLDDPFLIKLRLDYQVKNQLINENFIFASFSNLQNIAKELYTYVQKELGIITDKFGKLELNPEYYKFMKEKISFSPSKDWEFFISMNPNFLNIYQATSVQQKREIRSFKSIQLPYSNSIHNKCIRFGVLYKKSKLMKKYTRGFYVLTCNYLHEFKIENDESSNTSLFKKNTTKNKIGGFIGHEDVPVKSFNLNDCYIKVKDEKSLKFQLLRNSNAGKKYTFKCATASDYTNWYGDLEQLTKYGSKHLRRFELLQAKINLKESEEQKQKEAKDGKRGKTETLFANPEFTLSDHSNDGSQFKLSLDDESLTGIFTPTIKTPNASSPLDGNPFDKTFMNGIGQHANNSTNSLTSSVATNMSSPASPNDPGTSESKDAQESDLQHEGYLQMQQQILKQQLERLNLKLKEVHDKNISRSSSDQSLAPTAPSFSVLNGNSTATFNLVPGATTGTAFNTAFNSVPGPGNLKNMQHLSVSRESSNESLNAFVGGIPKNTQPILNKGTVLFALDSPPRNEKELPKVMLSQHPQGA